MTMAKRCTLVSSESSIGATSCTQVCPTDWNNCVLCQEVTQEPLVCPFNVTKEVYGSGYDTLAHYLTAFNEIGAVPMNINVSRLDDGSGILNTLKSHKASWHKQCYNKFSKLKLERAQKRKSVNDSDMASPVKTRSVQGVDDKSSGNKRCFFCDDDAGDMHRASTIDIDQKVWLCAMELQDTKLLAKLAMGDMHAIDADYHTKCLVALYNRYRQIVSKRSDEDTSQETLEGIALAELVAYSEET